MASVVAVMMIMACDPTLLLCTEVDGPITAWENTTACNQDSPGMVARMKHTLPDDRIVMIKCRLMLREDLNPPQTIIASQPETDPLF